MPHFHCTIEEKAWYGLWSITSECTPPAELKRKAHYVRHYSQPPNTHPVKKLEVFYNQLMNDRRREWIDMAALLLPNN